MEENTTNTNITIKRYEQACFEFVKDDCNIFIDPGDYGVPDNLERANAILVTHYHFDHVSKDSLEKAYKKNPNLKIYGPKTLKDNLSVPVNVVKEGDQFEVKNFNIKVFGKFQDVTSIYDDPIENVGYYIYDKIFHPGDALTYVEGIEAVIVPMAAPWAKFSEVEKYLKEMKAKFVIPNHDITLNEMGVDFALNSLENASKKAGSNFIKMKVNDEIIYK